MEATSNLGTWTVLATNSGPLAVETTVTDPVPLTESGMGSMRAET